MDAPLFDREGRLISNLHPGFRLFNIYFPNGQRGKERLDYRLGFYAQLLAVCDRLHTIGENIIITIDYFLISEALVARVKDVVIHDEVLGSDHCPVELILE